MVEVVVCAATGKGNTNSARANNTRYPEFPRFRPCRLKFGAETICIITPASSKGMSNELNWTVLDMQRSTYSKCCTMSIVRQVLQNALPLEFRFVIFRVHANTLRSFESDGLRRSRAGRDREGGAAYGTFTAQRAFRSEEHTSELQSRLHLVCRLLLE